MNSAQFNKLRGDYSKFSHSGKKTPIERAKFAIENNKELFSRYTPHQMTGVEIILTMLPGILHSTLDYELDHHFKKTSK